MRDDRVITHELAASLEPNGSGDLLVSIKYEQDDPETLDVRLRLLGSQAARRVNLSRLLQLEWNYVWVYGTGEVPRVIKLAGIGGSRGTADSGAVEAFIPDAAEVQIDVSSIGEAFDRTFHVKCELLPSGILVQPKTVEIDLNGEITNRNLQNGEVVVETTLAALEVAEYYRAYERQENGNRVRVQVERTSISGRVTVPQAVPLAEINRQLERVFTDICDMLSLCYRTPVTFYEITYFELEPRGREHIPSPLVRRKVGRRQHPNRVDDLVNWRDLISGGLDKLYHAYIDHKHQETIKRAVRFMVGSYTTVGIEQSYFLAFAALDAAVSAASDAEIESTLGSSQFRKLCKQIRKVIDDFSASAHQPNLPDDMGDKLAELQRRSLRRKIAMIRERLNLSADDLWVHLGFDAGLRRAISARNALVHAAHVADADSLFRDQVRVWVLTERIILRLLGWPNEKVWVHHDQQLRWMNEMENPMNEIGDSLLPEPAG